MIRKLKNKTRHLCPSTKSKFKKKPFAIKPLNYIFKNSFNLYKIFNVKISIGSKSNGFRATFVKVNMYLDKIERFNDKIYQYTQFSIML